jgi:hypothetical protein
LPVEGKVEKTIKGGYEVRIAGQRAFCPFSQMDLQKTADPNVHVGKVLTFRIIEYKEGGKNVILSRRRSFRRRRRPAPRRRASRSSRRGPEGEGRLGARLRRLRRPAAASRVSSTSRRWDGPAWPTPRRSSSRATS